MYMHVCMYAIATEFITASGFPRQTPGMNIVHCSDQNTRDIHSTISSPYSVLIPITLET